MLDLAQLPISKEFSRIEALLAKTSNLALRAPTGSGKSLGLPWQILKKNTFGGQVLVVQPRRIAALSLAKTLAGASGFEIGEEIGYRIRFEKRCASSTKILYATDGVLMRMIASDRTLSRIGTIIFDEFHERTLQMDASLALVRKIQTTQRPNLRIIVTSATVDLDSVCRYLGDSSKVEISGRSHPVEIVHKAIDPRIESCKQIEREAKRLSGDRLGNMLIFMDGAANISKVAREIQSQKWSKDFEVLKLFGEMRMEEQERALRDHDKRRIIVSTNIAETSLTIPDVRIVIDTGFAKIFSFDPLRGINSLLAQKISRSSADQRTGRAGRTAEGFCLRLWSETDHQSRDEYQKGEIHRLDLTSLCLDLLSQGLKPEELDWYEEPPASSWNRARANLEKMSLVEESGWLSETGKLIAEIPLQPKLSLALYYAKKRGFLSELALIMASVETRKPYTNDFIDSLKNQRKSLLSELNVLLEAFYFAQRNKFSVSVCASHGINVHRLAECRKIAVQLCEYFGEEFNPASMTSEEIIKILIQLYPDNIVRLKSPARKLFQDTRGRNVFLSPSSMSGDSSWGIALSVTEKMMRGQIQLQMDFFSDLKEEWIAEVLGERLQPASTCFFDLATRKVVAQNYLSFGEHKINLVDDPCPDESQVAHAYARVIFEGKLSLKKWTSEIDQLIERSKFLNVHFPEFDFDPIEEEDLLQVLEALCYGKKNWKQIRNTEVYPFFADYLGADKLRIMDEFAPQFLLLGNASKRYRLFYSKKEVVLRIKLQDLYDQRKHPTLAYNSFPVVLEVLAPNGNPVQRTQDLNAFWDSSYLQIKKDLAGRYPKHEWR